MIVECLRLFYVFFKIGIVGFGGGYAMLSMIMTESQQFGVTLEQLADLNALDMVVPGPLAINAATYWVICTPASGAPWRLRRPCCSPRSSSSPW
jgi:chromate transport protein ChrA